MKMGRRLISRFLRLFIGLFFLIFLFLYAGFHDNINHNDQIDAKSKSSDQPSNEKSAASGNGDGSSCQEWNKFLDYTDFGASDVRALFYSLNEKACIRNEEQFNLSTLKAVKYVLVVMVSMQLFIVCDIEAKDIIAQRRHFFLDRTILQSNTSASLQLTSLVTTMTI